MVTVFIKLSLGVVHTEMVCKIWRTTATQMLQIIFKRNGTYLHERTQE
jgi:hypothetical protein